jgi:hypothetical protein
MTMQDNRRALDRWARSAGWSDFDTYIRLGGGLGEVARDIDGKTLWLNRARAALYSYAPPPAPPPIERQPDDDADLEDYQRGNARMTIGEAALARAEAEASGEPVDPHNAHVQGEDDHAEA